MEAELARAEERTLAEERVPILDAFRYPSYRWLWANTASAALVQGVQRFAFVWLVLEISDLESAAGIVSFCLGVPVFLFALPAGVLSDRVSRRTLLIASQWGAIVVALLIAAAIWLDVMTLPLAFLAAGAMGATIAFGQPVRQAVLPSLVPRERLMNAIVLNTLGMNVMMIVGPALGGIVIRAFGLGGVFAAQATVFALGLLALLPLRAPPVARRERATTGVDDLREGLRWIARQRNIAVLMLLLVATGLLMMGPTMALLPQIAKEELGQDAFAASALFTFTGIGMFGSSMLLASWRGMRNKGAWFVGWLTAGGLIVMGLGLSPSYPLTAVLMLVWGIGGGFFVNLNQTLIQGNTPPELMGRVMSVHTLGFLGVTPLGSLLAGGMAAAMGAPSWMAVSGGLLALVGALTFVTQRDLRRMS